MKQTKFLKKTNKHPAWSLNATTTALAMAGLIVSNHAIAEVSAVADEVIVAPSSSVTIDVLANDSYPFKTDGTPLANVSIAQLPTLGSAELEGNKIKFTAPTNVGAASMRYTLTEQKLKYGDLSASDASPAVVNNNVDDSVVVKPFGQAGSVINQSNATTRQVWFDSSETEYMGVTVDPNLENLPQCTGAKYKISTEFSVVKTSGADDSFIGIRVGSRNETFSPTDATTYTNSENLRYDQSRTVNHETVYTGPLADLRVGLFVLNAVQNGANERASKFEWAPISLKISGTPDTSGCPDVTSTANITIKVDNNFDDVLEPVGGKVPDAIDTDDDNDGIPDILEDQFENPDSDGQPNRTDLDSDGDGIPDIIEEPNSCKDSTGVATKEACLDTDGDQIPDFLDTDSDGDSINDTLEAFHQPIPPAVTFSNFNTVSPENTDRDAFPDYRDLDSDNDGIQDVVEQKLTDDDGDGKADTGLGDSKTLEDTDQDGLANVWDLDSDNDAIPDIIEGNCAMKTTACTIAGIDVLNTVTGTYPKEIATPDGWATAFRTGSAGVPDTDGDGEDNFLDLDSDGDNIFSSGTDIEEAGWSSYDQNGDGQLDSPQGQPIQTWSNLSVVEPKQSGQTYIGPFLDAKGFGEPGSNGVADWAENNGQSDDPTTNKIITGIDGNGGGATGHLWATLLGLLVAVRRVRKSKGA